MAPSHIVIFVAALIGFLVTFFLRRQKVQRLPVKCLFKEQCHKVLDSKYSTFFALPTELMGMAYYVLVMVILRTLSLGLAQSFALILLIFLLTAATLAVIFSLRQIFIQAVVLRAWCSWCLLTAVLNVVIFVLLFYTARYFIVDLAEFARPVFLPIHLVTAILAVTAATISDLSFFRFIKDFWISARESKFLDRVSEVIWFLVVLFLVSGAATYLSDMEKYNATPKFWVKMVVVGVILVNGLALNLYLSPKLTQIPFNKRDDHLRSQQATTIRRARKVMFALGPISIVSWYTAMTLGFLKQVPFGWGFWELLGVYALLLAGAVTGGQIVGKMVYGKKR